MEVIAGKYKGAKIDYPGEATHPMGARQKLALFNMVEVEGASILDAFAGSGALGIEALSRGAKRVVFVDDTGTAIQVIKENLKRLKLMGTPMVKVVKSDLFDYASEKPFDIILADPPYTDFRPDLIERICRDLREGGLLVLSHPGEAPELHGLELLKSRHYAKANISIYAKH